jgi:hypothetical protein
LNRSLSTCLLLVSLCVLPQGTAAAPAPNPGEAYVFPSPSTPTHCAKIVYFMRDAGKAEVRVYHEDGTLAAHFVNRHEAGLQVIPLWSCGFAPGMYLYRVTLTYGSGLVEKLKSGWFVVSP